MPSRAVPTVDVLIEVRSGQRDWYWTTPSEPAAEMAYNRGEVLRLLRTYGNWGSIMTNGNHIRVTIRGRFSGRWIAQHEWYAGAPVGEPWVHIPSWHSLSFAAQLHIPPYTEHDEHRLIDTGATDVSTLRLAAVVDDPPMPDNIPHVRHREDVPHEHALPDLYGLPDDRFTQQPE
jgi:hypothetical protein